MNDLRTRFLQDDPSKRLLGIASNLGRVAACMRRPYHPGHTRMVGTFLQQSGDFIFWMLDSTSEDVRDLLIRLRSRIQEWVRLWPAIEKDVEQRRQLADQIKGWYERLMQGTEVFKVMESEEGYLQRK